jgi:threonine dehydrogenase-like Zn-dependent dehydrogenase
VTNAKAAVLIRTGPEAEFEIREFPLPSLGDNDGLLRVDLCGVCGSDYRRVRGNREDDANADRQDRRPLPAILGHEIVGTIAGVGATTAATWKLAEGDRVFVEASVPCGRCKHCATGHSKYCRLRWSYGLSADVAEPPHLWGGYAQYMYLHPRTIVHRLPDSMSSEDAVLVSPLSNGFQWAYAEPELKYGRSILIIGPGQQGLGCVAAARAVGAGLVMVSGLERDRFRLDVAQRLGADVTIEADCESVFERVRDATGGDMADVVVEVSGSPAAQRETTRLVRRGGTIVWAGGSGRPSVDMPMDDVVQRALTIKGVRSHEYDAIAQAIALVASGTLPVQDLATHVVSLEEAGRAVRLVGNEWPEERAIHVSIDPWMDDQP